MREFPVSEIDLIAQTLHERLGSAVQALYIYGSVATGSRKAQDLDLLLVTASQEHATIFEVIAEIQRRCSILIHPTVVNPRELQSNPFFRELGDCGIVLWRQA